MNCNTMDDSGTLKSILTGRRRSWLIGQRKKSVRFAVSSTKSRSNGRNSRIQEKWRKYVEQQFRTLKKHKRNRWLGRGKMCRRKPGKTKTGFKDNNSAATCGQGVAEHSFTNGLEAASSSSDVLPPFQVPLPDHKKRKKPGSRSCSQSKQRGSKANPRNNNSTLYRIRTGTRKGKHARKNKPRSKKSETSDAPPAKDDGELNVPTQQAVTPVSHIKRPLNAFILFSRACRLEFRNLLVPLFDSKVVAMVLGHIWRYLSKPERQYFYQEAEQCRQLFNEEKKERLEMGGEEAEAMKKPMNAFILFCQEQRVQLQPKLTGHGSGYHLVNRMSRKWQRLKPHEKKIYIERAQMEKALYNEKLRAMKEQERMLPTGDGQSQQDGEGDITEGSTGGKTANRQLLNKLSKNNNQWFIDPLDTQGSGPDSSTQVKTLNATVFTPSPPACKNIQDRSEARSFHLQVREKDPQRNDNNNEMLDDSKGPFEKLFSNSAGQTQADGSHFRGSSEGSDTSSTRKKRGRSKRKKRVKRKRPSRRVNRVSWKDETQPWDVFDPVSSALCDEDVCGRLYPKPEPRDDCSFFHSASTDCHLPGYSYQHCYNHPPRQCLSCLSLSGLKKQVEVAFRKPELELANCSSSMFSSCDMFPSAVLTDVGSSSSDDACLSHLFNYCHLSDCDVPCGSSGQSHTVYNDHCHRHCVVCGSCTGKAAKRALSISICPPEPSAVNQTTVVEYTSDSHKHDSICPLEDTKQTSITITPQSKCNQSEAMNQEEELYPSNSRNCKDTSSLLTYQKTDVEHVNSSDVQRDLKSVQDEPEKSRSPSCCFCKHMDEIIHSPISCSTSQVMRHANFTETDDMVPMEVKHEITMQQDDTAQDHDKEVPANEVHKEDGKLTEISKEQVSQDVTVKETKESTTQTVDNTNENVIEDKMLVFESVKSETNDVGIPRTGLHVDIVKRTGVARDRDADYVCHHETITAHHVANLSSDEDVYVQHVDHIVHGPNILSTPRDLSMSNATQGKITTSECLTTHSSQNHLKRKLSYDSLEALNSSNNFSIAMQSDCSLPKYAFALDHPRRSKLQRCGQNDNKSKFKPAAIVTKPRCDSSLPGIYMAKDLEMEYCQLQKWI